jgi:hypothetical protein
MCDRESILAAAMIAEPAMWIENRLGTLLALPDKLGSAPNTKMLAFLRQREITTFGTNPIFVE